MAEYIEVEELVKRICEEACHAEYEDCPKIKHDKTILCVCDFINFQPTADVAPVKHGRWIKQENYPGTYSKCSECDQRVGGYTPNYKFCPNCGARMDQEEAP